MVTLGPFDQATAQSGLVAVVNADGFRVRQCEVRRQVARFGQVGLLARIRCAPSREHLAVLDGTDQLLRSLNVEHNRGLLVSVGCHFLGFTLETFEIYLVVRFLDVPISIPSAFAIGAFSTAVEFFTFMVPSSLGALEGGYVAIFATFGLGGAIALTYTLVRRLREIVWVAAGFVASSMISSPLAGPLDHE